MLMTANTWREEYLPDDVQSRAITIVPDALLHGVRYVHIGKTLPWWSLFVAGQYPWKRPLRDSRCLDKLRAHAYRPLVVQEEKTEEQLFLAPLHAEAAVEAKNKKAKACERDVVISVPLKAIDAMHVLEKPGSQLLNARVWLREGRLYVADELSVLNALRAIALDEIARAAAHAPCTPPKKLRDAPREKTWWIGSCKKEAAHWLVRTADKKKKKFYVKHSLGEGEACFEEKKNKAKEEAEEYFDSTTSI